MMRESEQAETQRTKEDSGAAVLVDKCKAKLAEDTNYRDVFNPARDGDCLMRCSVKHDFSYAEISILEAASGGAGDKSETGAEDSGVLTADELRIKVVDRVEEIALSSLKTQAEAADAKASKSTDLLEREQAVADAAWLRGARVAAAQATCEVMARPGVVMGEDELQALADVRQACVEVRTIVCVQASSDFGAFLPLKTYRPSPLPPGRPCVGKGGTLVLLHELRAARMSHYQLIRFR
jgi:hypothetical protein